MSYDRWTAAQLAQDLAPAARALARALYVVAIAEGDGDGEALGVALGLEGPVAPVRARLALETAYALCVMLVYARVATEREGEPFAAIATRDDAALGAWCRARAQRDALAPDARYAWYADAWSPDVAAAVRGVLAPLAGYDARVLLSAPHGRGDLFRAFYQAVFPAALRHAMGEYYTPRWLAQAVLAELTRPAGWRGLDPCCGSGSFVVELIDAVLAETAGLPREGRRAAVLARVHARDLNPLAVLTARANYGLAIAPLLDDAAIAPPVELGDALTGIGAYDCVVGNPPWVEWKDLPADYRARVGAFAQAHGLLGDAYAGGNDLNLCALIAQACLAHWVAPGGRLAFLMPRQLLHLRAAAGLRRWRLADGTPLALCALADWSALRPFEAACQPMTYSLRRDAVGPEAVPVTIYRTAGGARPREASWAEVAPGLAVSRELAIAATPGAPYLIERPEMIARSRALLGGSAYRGRRATETSPHGVFWLRPLEAGPGATYWVENDCAPRAKARVPRERCAIECAWLFPLLRGTGVRAFAATPEPTLLLFPHAPDTGADAVPPEGLPAGVRAYLERHRERLEARGSFRKYRAGGAYYALWRVGAYTFAPYKVVWPELGALRAAVVSTAPTPWGELKPIVPEGKLNLIPCERAEEAHYVCALLNAPSVGRAYARVSSQIGRPAQLPIALPAYDAARFSHRALAAVSRAAHDGFAEARWQPLLEWLLGRVIGA